MATLTAYLADSRLIGEKPMEEQTPLPEPLRLFVNGRSWMYLKTAESAVDFAQNAHAYGARDRDAWKEAQELLLQALETGNEQLLKAGCTVFKSAARNENWLK
ncbi:hypothetical protein [Chelativorans sp.]|uniref:hypothetical protein n=1 Tax=Chelativorans sp. TaxID=2203393 RepID=UPI002810D232|nr:hypothetical protein [Chelativorans sp.]